MLRVDQVRILAIVGWFTYLVFAAIDNYGFNLRIKFYIKVSIKFDFNFLVKILSLLSLIIYTYGLNFLRVLLDIKI